MPATKGKPASLVAILALLACACHRKPTPRPLSARLAGPSPAPAGFATCDFVTVESTGVLTAWKLGAAGAEHLGSTSVGTPAGSVHGDWADREHLFVRTGPSTVKLVTRDGFTDIAVPELRRQVPKPDEDATATVDGTRYTRVDLIVATGEAWWSQCPWSERGTCAAWISARLWPDPTTTVRALVEGREDRWAEDPPDGYDVSRDPAAVTCAPPTGGASTILPIATAESSEIILGARWLSARPPRLLVTFGPYNEAEPLPPARWALYDACEARLAQGTLPRPNLDGTWTGIEAGALVLRRGAKVLARVPIMEPESAQLLVRPQR